MSFNEPDNLAVITCQHVIHDKMPILYVSHDEDDDGWQFLCGKTNHTENEARIVSLEEIVKLEPELEQIAYLKKGQQAERRNILDKWKNI